MLPRLTGGGGVVFRMDTASVEPDLVKEEAMNIR
jgi:hypothetical protein